MTTTTDYGTWQNATGTLNVASYIAEAFDTEGTDGFDTDAIESDLRDAVNDALPAGFALTGDEFIGPHPAEDIDIKEIVEEACEGFWTIAQKHCTDGTA